MHQRGVKFFSSSLVLLRMQTKSIFLFFIICLFLIPMLFNPCQAIEEEYSLKIKITTSCAIPYQSVSSIVVSVKLTNMGNETFNGTLTIKGKTKDSSYASREYLISNLTKDAVQAYTYSVATDYAGRYWFTIKIEEEHLSTIELYEDSELTDKGIRVEAEDSIFLRSFTEFIAILGAVVGAIVSIAVAVYMKKK